MCAAGWLPTLELSLGSWRRRCNFRCASKMPKRYWARLRVELECQLRRGAWYPVKRLWPQVILDVGGEPVNADRQSLDITSTAPDRWCVVPRPNPVLPGVSEYAVCPKCRDRVPLAERFAMMRCQRCGELFEVAWDERYLGT